MNVVEDPSHRQANNMVFIDMYVIIPKVVK